MHAGPGIVRCCVGIQICMTEKYRKEEFRLCNTGDSKICLRFGKKSAKQQSAEETHGKTSVKRHVKFIISSTPIFIKTESVLNSVTSRYDQLLEHIVAGGQ